MSKFDKIKKEQFVRDYEEKLRSDVAIKYNISEATVNNWARDLLLPRKIGKWRDLLEYKLTDIQRSVVIGSMFGDGSCSKSDIKNKKRPHQSRFIEVHGIEQYDWLDWKRKILFPLIKKELLVGKSEGRINLGNGKVISDTTREYMNCHLQTIVHPVFTEIEQKWYLRDSNGNYILNEVGRRIKIIPRDVTLDKLALAVCFLDDGHNEPIGRRCLIYLNDFRKEEVDFFVELVKKIGINCKTSIYSEKPNVFIGADSYFNFIELIKQQFQEIPESVIHKVDLTGYKISWKESSNYHPHSLLNDEIVHLIMEDAIINHTSQIELEKKYKIHHNTINKLLRGNTLYETKIDTTNRYNNTTGINHFFLNDRNRYIGHVEVNGESIYLGCFMNKENAEKVSKKVAELQEAKCVDIKEYEKLRIECKEDRSKYNYLVDIDGCCCQNISNENSHLYSTAKVLEGAVEFVNDLYKRGHRITFFTARESKDKEVTEKWLKEHGFKYHQIIMDKPRATHGEYRWIDDIPVKGFHFTGDFEKLAHELHKNKIK